MKPYTKTLSIEIRWHGRKPIVLEFVKVGNKLLTLSPRRINPMRKRHSTLPVVAIEDVETAFSNLIGGTQYDNAD